MYRTPVIIKLSPLWAKQEPSTSCRGLVRPVGAYFHDNDGRSIQYLISSLILIHFYDNTFLCNDQNMYYTNMTLLSSLNSY